MEFFRPAFFTRYQQDIVHVARGTEDEPLTIALERETADGILD